MRFAGERAVIVDAVALGILRKALIEMLGLDAARTIFTRFGTPGPSWYASFCVSPGHLSDLISIPRILQRRRASVMVSADQPRYEPSQVVLTGRLRCR